ncbi:peptide chain release factor N(5)-glutamine methyltransferase [Acetivibrio ethanolgignens]|uniref:Release factor glutamine methyltransferase n=1 Tax=Acetivibrio ethanolgignens TaxID=290052 RepID=A0A0V8QEU1_9FIRM|nr:peptide chain release factor N(5)-glutamine methyltransferase [Acetivibrio ethanolgignens]KSV58926.1 protein-(glutamine-N5) methyltransferase, release factor-specific [Acetivibrio ethanolgignens]
MRIDAILKKGETLLSAAGIEEAKLDAFYLLEHCFSMNRMEYLMHCDKEGDAAAERRYFSLIKKRSEHIPLQQLTGEQDFMGYTFLVNEHVLIPRQDTETLVEELLPLAKGKRVLDMCTGSGCILISLALKAGILSGVGADISPEALEVAKENARRLGAAEAAVDGLQFIETDLFEKIEGAFDLIVSNPPYIETKELAGLQPEVRLHEPMLALDGKEDGLYFYRRIIEKAENYLTPGGILAFEIGYNQGKAVSELMLAAGYQGVQVKKDLPGLDRIVTGKLCK